MSNRSTRPAGFASPVTGYSVDTSTWSYSAAASWSGPDGAEMPSPTTRPVRRDDPSETAPGLRRGHTQRTERTRQLFGELAGADPERRQSIMDEIVELNLPVADGVASRYARRSISEEDLTQVARLALVRAVHAFQPMLGHEFLVYAVPCIRGEIRRYFRDAGWSVRPPRRVQEAEYRIQRLQPELVHELGRQPTAAELADRLDLPEPTVIEALTLHGCFNPDSLDRPVLGQEDGALVVSDRLGATDAEFELCEIRAMLAPLIGQLPARDRTVLRLRFIDGLTQREVGERIGVTQMQVSRILGRILGHLRDQLGPVETGTMVPAA